LNAAQFLGRIIPATLSDRFGGEHLLFAAQVLGGILGFSWIAVHNLGCFITFLIFYGFVSGMMATLPAVVVPYMCPSLNFVGTRMGMIYASAGVGALIGTPIATAAMGSARNYWGAQVWMEVTSLVGALFFIPAMMASTVAVITLCAAP
jgi:MFS family permease